MHEFSTVTYSRTKFLQHMGAGILTASLPFAPTVSRGEALDTKLPAEPKKIPRSPLNAPTEGDEPEFYPAPQNPAKRMGYAIVGLGHLALTDVMPAFVNCKHSRPVALVSGDREKATTVAEQYGIDSKNIYDYANFDRIADNKEIDAVYIILPNSLHHEYTIRAARAGKHVLCEKPMANSVKECEEMIAACKQAKRKLMVAYRIQFEPRNRMIRDWIRKKEYGNVKLMELFNGQNIGDPTQWRLKKSLAGGGSLVDVGIYCLNTARFLLGQEPEAVFGNSYTSSGDERFREVEETMLFQLKFPGGVQVSCVTTYGSHMQRRYRAFTDAGAWFGMDPAFSYRGLKMELSQAKGKAEFLQYPYVEEKNQFAIEIDHFSQCIANDQQPYTPGEEGLQDYRILDAIYRSAREGKWVSLEKHSGLDVFRGPDMKEDS